MQNNRIETLKKNNEKYREDEIIFEEKPPSCLPGAFCN